MRKLKNAVCKTKRMTVLLLAIVTVMTTVFQGCQSNEIEEPIFLHNEKASLETLSNVIRGNVKNNKVFLQKKSLNEDEAKLMLTPIINETISLLLNEGVSKNEIVKEFGSIDSPEIALLGVTLLAETSNSNFIARERTPVLDCVARAFVGMELSEGFWKSFTNRRVLLKAVGKLATRALGFIGAALVVYDFADCMWG